MRNASQALARSRRLRFEKRVDRAISQLSPHVKRALDNVVIVVESEPEDGNGDQFGVYEGIPLSERTQSYGMTVPDRIVLFQGPLERAFPDPVELDEQIRITVLHEIGHHLGFDEVGLDRIGLG
jgi:predicted Zn-dependent protease with MMP-like domain